MIGHHLTNSLGLQKFALSVEIGIKLKFFQPKRLVKWWNVKKWHTFEFPCGVRIDYCRVEGQWITVLTLIFGQNKSRHLSDPIYWKLYLPSVFYGWNTSSISFHFLRSRDFFNYYLIAFMNFKVFIIFIKGSIILIQNQLLLTDILSGVVLLQIFWKQNFVVFTTFFRNGSTPRVELLFWHPCDPLLYPKVMLEWTSEMSGVE